MITKRIKLLLAGLLFLNIAALTSCKDDDLTDPSLPTKTTGEMELARKNSFYNLDVSNNGDWKVASCPEWVGLMNEEGTAGEKLLVFAEENDEDLDRRDTIVINIDSKSLVRIPLRQFGRVHDGENAEAELLTNDEDLKITYGVGYSTDVLKLNTNKGMKYYVLVNSPFNYAKLLKAIQDVGESDAAFSEPLYSSRYESITGSSTSDVSNQLGVNAGIEVGIKAFKFSVEAGYSSSSTSNDKYMYGMQEIQHIVGSHYIRGGVMRHLAQTKPKEVLQGTFYKAAEKLRKNPNDKSAMATIINNYGTHVITRGTLGGELKVSMKMKITDETDASSIHAALGLSSKVIKVDGSFSMDNKEKNVASNTTLSLQSYGGKNVYTIAPGTTFEKFQQEVKDTLNMEEWVSSIKDMTSLALIDMETIPVWDLMPTEESREALHNYVVGDYQRQIYGDDFKPDLYVVKGYKVEEAPGSGSIYIPEIDVMIQAESTIIPELSQDEFSTIIYSGPQGNVNRNHGFFVGSKTRKPCKVHFAKDGSVALKKDGTLDIEIFDRLSEAAIGELYVDVTGDVTIATKSVTDLYQTVEITNWRHDISTLTKDWTAKSDLTITGKTDHCISIADGVTLTLDTVTVNNQIVCLGDANIVLKDGTKNSVICPIENKAGIQVGPTGKTLSLSGNGELETRGGKVGAGIGGSASNSGNIQINGGAITAKAGEGHGAPGIGACWSHSCGTITITGGTITAVGSNNSAAIGSGLGGSCGKIEISGGTVTAQGTFCAAGIGSGWQGKCEDIVISGGTVTATGGGRAAGIGSGCSASCGNITITKGVQAVKATCGKGDTCVPIGAGDNSTCGTVTIESGANVEEVNPNVVVNLDELAENYTVTDEAKLYGTTDHAIRIADGAKVTLAGVTIKNSIVCDGNARVILEAGTTNKIETPGDYVSTLRNGAAGTTLTIEGEGTLISTGRRDIPGIGGNGGDIVINGGIIEATGGYGGAGIGANLTGTCGNITINGGQIVAYGGVGAAGIGSGGEWNDRPSHCGNILITGGTIYAKAGGYYSAVIGSGAGSHCGNITVKNTVTQLTVEKYSSSSSVDWFGAGRDGTCGTVTIEDGANIIRK